MRASRELVPVEGLKARAQDKLGANAQKAGGSGLGCDNLAAHCREAGKPLDEKCSLRPAKVRSDSTITKSTTSLNFWRRIY